MIFSMRSAVLAWAFATAVCGADLRAVDGLRWYKGNTHAHTLWSDGDAAPEVVADWYKEHGYHFLCLSDHNVYLGGERWVPVAADQYLTPDRVKAIQQRFGEGWVSLDQKGDRLKMRLKTFEELQAHFDEPGKFLMVSAEEVTSKVVHVNAVNNRGFIKPAQAFGNKPLRLILAENFDAIEAHGKENGVPILAHLNHPNWDQGVTAEDIVSVGGERFFEIYNGHAGVRNWGDRSQHKQSTDRLWDIILAIRLSTSADRPLYGMGTDDSHDYYEQRIGLCNSGRGWVQVLAKDLSPGALIAAMQSGQFYASSGVTLERIADDGKSLSVGIHGEAGVTHTTHFIGTRKGFDATARPVLDPAGNPVPNVTQVYSEDIGEVLFETKDNPAVYAFTGDELYVRAKVVSDKPQPNPHAEGDLETAWTQPARPY